MLAGFIDVYIHFPSQRARVLLEGTQRLSLKLGCNQRVRTEEANFQMKKKKSLTFNIYFRFLVTYPYSNDQLEGVKRRIHLPSSPK